MAVPTYRRQQSTTLHVGWIAPLVGAHMFMDTACYHTTSKTIVVLLQTNSTQYLLLVHKSVRVSIKV